jgi:hypothetical protein
MEVAGRSGHHAGSGPLLALSVQSKKRFDVAFGGVPGGRMERRQFLQTMGFGATALLLMTLTSSISCGAVSSTK